MAATRGIASALAGAVAVATLVTADPALAMPGFARKYRMSCTTCHAPFPRLKPYGEEFAARGFRLEDPAQEPSRAVQEVGDPLLQLARELPVGMRLEGFTTFEEASAADNDFEWPWVWKVISGGPVSPTVSYYFYFLSERGAVEGLEDAYLQVERPLGAPLTLVAGQFQVCDPLFKRETRLEYADYEIYRARVGDAGVNLTYDRGLVLGWDAPGEIETVLQVVNGNGIPHADEERNFDNDDHKNVALRFARSTGKARLGMFGYWGQQDDDAGVTNETWYAGPDLALPLGDRVELNLQYLERRDDNPFFLVSGAAELETRGGFAELHLFPRGPDGRWAVSGLYNRVESDDAEAEMEGGSVTLSYLLARNVRFLFEAGRADERNRATMGLVSAF